jgi:hypothetical protein
MQLCGRRAVHPADCMKNRYAKEKAYRFLCIANLCSVINLVKIRQLHAFVAQSRRNNPNFAELDFYLCAEIWNAIIGEKSKRQL